MSLLYQLVAIAEKTHKAHITYRKTFSAKSLPRRLVEPYSFSQGKEDLMVRCYQLEPEDGWRFFMIHKVESVEDTGQRFTPRRPITLPEGSIHPTFAPDPIWTDGLQQYRDLVADAMADGSVTPYEFSAIRDLIAREQLTIEQVRFVHAHMFHRCLEAILKDGSIDQDERAGLAFLHEVFSALGWSIVDG